MKKIMVLSMAMVIFFVGSSFAELKLVSMPTPTKKIRFSTSSGEYIASFVSHKSAKELNYPRITKFLEKHFSEEREDQVQGLIWENCKEEKEEIRIIIKGHDNSEIGTVKIAVKYFSHEGKFFYRIGKLEESSEEALGQGVVLADMRKLGDSSLPRYIITNDNWLIYDLN